MKRRSVGSASLELPEITFGTGDTGGVLIHGSAEQQRSVVAHAMSRGVDCFDTSPDYGKGMAEANLGRVLRELDVTDAVTLISKVEVMPEHLDMIEQRVAESIDDSLFRLGRTSLDVVMLHNPIRFTHNTSVRFPWTPLTPADVLGRVLPAFRVAQQSGKARYIGLACERAEVDAVAQVLHAGGIDLIHVWFNLTNPSASLDRPVRGLSAEEDYAGLFSAARSNGVGVASIRPLAGGALTRSVREHGVAGRHVLSRGYFSAFPEMLTPDIKRGMNFDFLDRPPEHGLSNAAYRFILGHDVVATVIGGFSESAHLDDAIRAVEDGPLSDSDLTKVAEVHRRGYDDAPQPDVYSRREALT